MSWTQPICDDCWDAERPDMPSPRVEEGARETCCLCGSETRSGIYVRRDPLTVPFPSE